MVQHISPYQDPVLKEPLPPSRSEHYDSQDTYAPGITQYSYNQFDEIFDQ